MRTLLNALVIPALACLPMLVHAENPAAGAIIMNTITPNEAAPGVVATIKGENLDAQHIKLVYLFNGEMNFPVEVVDQKAVALKVRVPAVPVGRYRIVVEEVASGMFLEEPISLKVLAPPTPTGE